MITRDFLYTPEFEGAFHPGFLAGTEASAGAKSGGTENLVRELETHLGLPARPVTALERIGEAAEALKRHLAGRPGAFFARSFNVDPLGTSRRLLAWRDELLLYGWEGEPDKLPDRPREAISALAAAGNSLPPGTPDRITALIGEIARRGEKVFDTLRLLREREKEALLVRRLLAALEETGTEILPRPESAPPDRVGDLAGAARPPKKDETFSPEGDGTLLRILGGSPFEAAEALSAWLAERGTEDTVLIAGGRIRSELEAAFLRYHLPRIGAGTVSRYRAALQILPLALGLQWGPLDPARLLQFLQLPLSPIPRSAGRILARAVAEAPGIGGPLWKESVETCLREADAGDSTPRAALEERFRDWLPDPDRLIPPGEAIEKDRLIALCRRFTAWARAREAAQRKKREADPTLSPWTGPDAETRAVLKAASGQAEVLARLLEKNSSPTIPQLEAARLVELAGGSGVMTGRERPEAGGVKTVSSPAALLGPAETVIWWDFTGAGAERLPEPLFTAAEEEKLRKAGIEIPSRGNRALELSRSWHRPLRYARRLILVSHRLEKGEPAGDHPLWNQLTADWKEPDKNRLTVVPSRLRREKSPLLPIGTRDLAPLELPQPQRLWKLKSLSPAPRELESATSLEKIVFCPFQYALEYQAKLKPADAVALKSGPLALGNVAHRAVEDFLEGKAGGGIDEILDRVLREEGAVYLLPGREGELARLHLELTAAVEKLSRLLEEHSLEVIGFEEKLEAETGLGRVGGRLDVYLQEKAGGKQILDLKYSSRGSKNYRQKLEDGTAVQLAVYRQLAGGSAGAAYFSIKDGELLPANPSLPGFGQPIIGPDLDRVWEELAAAVRAVRERQLTKGFCAAGGIAPGDRGERDEWEPEGNFGRFTPKCGFCDYRPLCGFLWQPAENLEEWKKSKKKQKSS
ncbi:MAG: PD-(D/E)XK nuclease family protein [Candidatus Erginobacter occultus]|nr:PD-(D/E)XK nuclease family protein [Candidatus Erginobacter occultus]